METPAPVELLVVDDVPEIGDLFRGVHRRLKTVASRLTVEHDARRAVALVRARRFDVVLSDFRMEGADGIEVLRAARAANPAGRRALVTGYNEVPADLARILDASVDAYVEKPLDVQDTLLLLADLLAGDAARLAPYRAHARAVEAAALRDASRATA